MKREWCAGMVDRDLQKMRDSSDTDTASSAAESGAHEAQSLAAEGEGRGDMAGCGEEDMRRLVIDWAIEHVVMLSFCSVAPPAAGFRTRALGPLSMRLMPALTLRLGTRASCLAGAAWTVPICGSRG
jgi:hypothetical protein